MMKRIVGMSIVLALIAGCSWLKPSFKVAATPIPHVEILEFIRPDLEAQGIRLKIIVNEDYNIPNQALANGEVDANFFQHIPFMEEQIREYHYPIESIAPIILEPMGIYSKKVSSLEALSEGARIAIPSDPSNHARALLLLQREHLIELNAHDPMQATVLDITSNPKHLVFLEMDAGMLTRLLPDVDAAVINTNFALEAKLFSLRDALVLERQDSPYANVLVVRIGDREKREVQALYAALTSEKLRKFIQEKYQGAVIPVW